MGKETDGLDNTEDSEKQSTPSPTIEANNENQPLELEEPAENVATAPRSFPVFVLNVDEETLKADEEVEKINVCEEKKKAILASISAFSQIGTKGGQQGDPPKITNRRPSGDWVLVVGENQESSTAGESAIPSTSRETHEGATTNLASLPSTSKSSSENNTSVEPAIPSTSSTTYERDTIIHSTIPTTSHRSNEAANINHSSIPSTSNSTSQNQSSNDSSIALSMAFPFFYNSVSILETAFKPIIKRRSGNLNAANQLGHSTTDANKTICNKESEKEPVDPSPSSPSYEIEITNELAIPSTNKNEERDSIIQEVNQFIEDRIEKVDTIIHPQFRAPSDESNGTHITHQLATGEPSAKRRKSDHSILSSSDGSDDRDQSPNQSLSCVNLESETTTQQATSNGSFKNGSMDQSSIPSTSGESSNIDGTNQPVNLSTGNRSNENRPTIQSTREESNTTDEESDHQVITSKIVGIPKISHEDETENEESMQ